MKQIVVCFLGVLFFSSCLSPHSERVVDVDPIGWASGQGVELRFENLDTLSVRDLDVLLRGDGNFRDKQFSCEIMVTAPSGKTFYEDVDLDFEGRITENHNSGMQDYQLNYRSEVLLSERGEYSVRFTPRTNEPIRGVWGIGVKFE